jgi:hypothetical protein
MRLLREDEFTYDTFASGGEKKIKRGPVKYVTNVSYEKLDHQLTEGSDVFSIIGNSHGLNIHMATIAIVPLKIDILI